MKNKSENVGKKSLVREVFDWVICIVVAFTVALLIKYFIFTPTLVKQTSMTPTIKDGERVLINRIVRTFNLPLYRGDIITFEKPVSTDDETGVAKYSEGKGLGYIFTHDILEVTKTSYIKRIIGIEGDHVRISNGNVYVNDKLLNEIYLAEDLETPRTGDFCDLIVPDDCIFVMGDNRSGSVDSRTFGCIPLNKVEGRVIYRIWPLSEFGKIDK